MLDYNYQRAKLDTLTNHWRKKSIPTQKLLIKRHKEPNTNGKFPTRLVISAKTIPDNFAKVGYISVMSLLEKHQVEYKIHIIT